MTDEYVHIFRESPIGLLLFESVYTSAENINWICRDANPSACQMLNIAVPGGLSIDAFFPFDVVEALLTKDAVTSDFFLADSMKWLTLNRVQHESKMILTVADVTAQKEVVNTNERTLKLYQALSNSLSDNEIFIFDKDYNIILTEGSPRYVRFNDEENFIGKNLNELIDSGKFSFLKSHINEIFNQDKRNDFEHEIEGNFYTTSLYSAGNRETEANNLTGVLLIKDVTALNRKQRELELLNKRIDRSNQDLENFAYVASHDLHAPLRKIQSFGKLLADRYAEVLTGQGKTYLERILVSAQRMERLLDDLLSYSRATRNTEELIPTDLGQILQEVLSDHNLTDHPNITLDIPHDLPVIPAIPSQMRQLFQNLLDNACKFVRVDVPPVIQLRYYKIQAPAMPELELLPDIDYCVLEVEDNGIGFDQENAERIFNIFQRLHGLSEYKGSGIGLAICKKVVDNHRGGIKARGEKGVGAIFTVVLPFA